MTIITGCAGVKISNYSYNDSYEPNQALKTEDCYDASVLLTKDLTQSKLIAKKALAAIDTTIENETDVLIFSQRNRHIGVFVGSGGEEISISLKPVSDDRTFISVANKTGFVGGAGQKAWSCQIVDTILSLANK